MTTTNRLAVVTGGIGGIGSAICVRLTQDGHKVVATYHPAEQEKAEEWSNEMRQQGMDIGIMSGDVSSAEDCATMMKNIPQSESKKSDRASVHTARVRHSRDGDKKRGRSKTLKSER